MPVRPRDTHDGDLVGELPDIARHISGASGIVRFSGDVDHGVQQTVKELRIAAIDVALDDAPVSKQLQVGGRRAGADHLVGALHRGADGNEHAIALSADQFIEGGRYGIGEAAMTEHGNAIGDGDGAKAVLRCSPHENAIPLSQLDIRICEHIDALACIFDKKGRLIDTPVYHRRLKRDRQTLFCLGVAQSMNGTQRAQRGGHGSQRSRGASKNHREYVKQPLHRAALSGAGLLLSKSLNTYRHNSPRNLPCAEKIPGDGPQAVKPGSCALPILLRRT